MKRKISVGFKQTHHVSGEERVGIEQANAALLILSKSED
jgi:hypothetical protein